MLPADMFALGVQGAHSTISGRILLPDNHAASGEVHHAHLVANEYLHAVIHERFKDTIQAIMVLSVDITHPDFEDTMRDRGVFTQNNEFLSDYFSFYADPQDLLYRLLINNYGMNLYKPERYGDTSILSELPQEPDQQSFIAQNYGLSYELVRRLLGDPAFEDVAVAQQLYHPEYLTDDQNRNLGQTFSEHADDFAPRLYTDDQLRAARLHLDQQARKSYQALLDLEQKYAD